jgi:uncharacterized protein
MSDRTHFEVYQDDDGGFSWRMRADNGEIVAEGESYARIEDCLHAIELFKKHAATAPVQRVP